MFILKINKKLKELRKLNLKLIKSRKKNFPSFYMISNRYKLNLYSDYITIQTECQ
jgi:hypothetical protein